MKDVRHVFIPYSPRSWDGIVNDVLAAQPDAKLHALVLQGEEGPSNARNHKVSPEGFVPLIALERGLVTVVANGGPTALSVAAVLLAQRFRAPLVNVQRDGMLRMNTDPDC